LTEFLVRPRFTLVVLLVAVNVCAATQASAQSGGATPRAPQGLFGAVRPTTPETKRLDFTASLVEGYDDDVPTQLSPSLDPSGLQAGGFWTMVNATAEYNWSGKRAQLNGTAASNFRHYADLGETRSMGHGAGLGVTLKLPARTSLFVNQALASSPTFMYDLFPSGPIVEPGRTPTTAPDYSITSLDSYAYSTTTALRHDFTSRSHLSATGDYTYTDRVEETPTLQDVTSQGFRGEYSQNVTRNTALSLQYRYRKGDYGYAAATQSIEHGVDVGVDFSRPLSATRRVLVNFRIGTARSDLPGLGTDALTTQRQYLTVGQVGFGYDFVQTWQARAHFRRGLEYVVDLPHPVVADGVGFSVAGLLARRMDVLASAAYSSGESLVNRNSLRFDTYTGNLRLRYALTKTVATFVDYLYYYYDFRGNLQLLVGMPTGLERNGIRAGVTLWVPAFRR
jgi:hypothetical protein